MSKKDMPSRNAGSSFNQRFTFPLLAYLVFVFASAGTAFSADSFHQLAFDGLTSDEAAGLVYKNLSLNEGVTLVRESQSTSSEGVRTIEIELTHSRLQTFRLSISGPTGVLNFANLSSSSAGIVRALVTAPGAGTATSPSTTDSLASVGGELLAKWMRLVGVELSSASTPLSQQTAAILVQIELPRPASLPLQATEEIRRWRAFPAYLAVATQYLESRFRLDHVEKLLITKGVATSFLPLALRLSDKLQAQNSRGLALSPIRELEEIAPEVAALSSDPAQGSLLENLLPTLSLTHSPILHLPEVDSRVQQTTSN